jgi:hypothetical protein
MRTEIAAREPIEIAAAATEKAGLLLRTENPDIAKFSRNRTPNISQQQWYSAIGQFTVQRINQISQLTAQAEKAKADETRLEWKQSGAIALAVLFGTVSVLSGIYGFNGGWPQEKKPEAGDGGLVSGKRTTLEGVAH